MKGSASLIILSGPSGCGKDTVLNEVRKHVGGIGKTISCTTRGPRSKKGGGYEQHGVDYFFISCEEFEEKIRQGGFLEYANVHGDWYGTPADYIEKLKDDGHEFIILNIEDAGADQVKALYPEAVSVFVLPPDATELRRRLIGRDSEPSQKQEERYEKGKAQMKRAYDYDYVVMNDDVERAAKDIMYILYAVRCRAILHRELIDRVNASYAEADKAIAEGKLK